MTTTYVLDTATPLTMVLAEQTGTETITYLHGLGLVAQSDGATTRYFAYDGLGSVRQVADEAGSPLLTQTFDPYGSLYARAGIAETAWGFTGEQTDANGLLHLRARYYAPWQGRFFQLDPSRLEMNLYQYSYNSPLNYADPSGLNPVQEGWFRDDARNLTHWLVKAMRENAQSFEIRALNDLNRRANLAAALVPIAGLTGHKCQGDILAQTFTDLKNEAGEKFADLVRLGAKFDFKAALHSQLGPDVILCTSSRCRWYSYEMIANIHFGYIGRAAGFTYPELHIGAGQAQSEDNPGTGSWRAFGDEPEDAAAIDIGIDTYNMNSGGSGTLTIIQFQRQLAQRWFYLKRGVPQDTFKPSDLPPTSNGPDYPLEQFNGGGSG